MQLGNRAIFDPISLKICRRVVRVQGSQGFLTSLGIVSKYILTTNQLNLRREMVTDKARSFVSGIPNTTSVLLEQKMGMIHDQWVYPDHYLECSPA